MDEKKILYQNLWSVKETAKFLHIAIQTLRKWTSEKKIPFYKINRIVRYDPNKIQRWLLKKEKKP